MAIEPLASVMTIQAQGTMTGRQAAQEVKQAEPDSTKIVQDVVRIDKTTSVVDQSKNKGYAGSGESGEQQTKEQSNEQIRKAMEQLNKSMPHSEAVFGIHEDTNRVMIKIVDKETKEVIKELPPEKTLDLIAKAWELAGMLVDEKR